MYIEAFDQWGNSNNITFYINAYYDYYYEDYDPPQIETNQEYWHTIYYTIGTSEKVEFTLYDANPTDYELYIDGELIKSGSYSYGTTISFDLKTYITTTGDHTIKIIAYDQAGNSEEMKLKIKATDDSGSTEPTETESKQTLELPFSFWSLLLAVPVITIITKRYRKVKR